MTMSWDRFCDHVERLRGTYGKAAYGDDRVKLIWREVMQFSDKWFEGIIDELIGVSKYAPLLPEIREFASKERERLRAIAKREEANDAKEFFSSYGTEDIKLLAQTIKARISGHVGDENWKGFVKGLDHVASESKGRFAQSCGYCGGTGKIMAESRASQAMYAFRCVCPKGRGYARFPEWQPELTKQYCPEYHSATFSKESA